MQLSKELQQMQSLNQQSPNVSGRYKLLPLETIENKLAVHGWTLDRVTTPRKRLITSSYYGKYLAFFSNPSFKSIDENIELIVYNSNDGTKSLTMMGGVFRFACANGLIIGDSIISSKRLIHIGEDFNRDFETELYRIVAGLEEYKQKIELMKNKLVPQYDINRLTKEALLLRFPVEQVEKHYRDVGHVELVPQRVEDQENTVWNVYNRVQEYLLRGGIDLNKRKSRAVTAQGRVLKLNRELSNIFDQYLVA